MYLGQVKADVEKISLTLVVLFFLVFSKSNEKTYFDFPTRSAASSPFVSTEAAWQALLREHSSHGTLFCVMLCHRNMCKFTGAVKS